MKSEEFILVLDTQRKCYYLTVADALKNIEGLRVIEKLPNEARAIDALKKYSSGQKVFGTMTPKLNLKDAMGMKLQEAIEDKTKIEFILKTDFKKHPNDFHFLRKWVQEAIQGNTPQTLGISQELFADILGFLEIAKERDWHKTYDSLQHLRKEFGINPNIEHEMPAPTGRLQHMGWNFKQPKRLDLNMNLKDAVGDLASDDPNDGVYSKPLQYKITKEFKGSGGREKQDWYVLPKKQK